MIGSTPEAWLCHRSRSDGDVLQVWFSCSLVLSEHVVNMTSTRGLHQGQAAICSSAFFDV